MHTISDITLLFDQSQKLYTPYTHSIWYHLTVSPATTAIHTIQKQYFTSAYYLSGHKSYKHHIPKISDITLLSVRLKQLLTPYNHNIWYHLPICPVTTAVHTIHTQYLTSPYYLSRHKSFTHNIPTISDITLLSVQSQQLHTPYNHNIWYHLTICPVTTAVHTI